MLREKSEPKNVNGCGLSNLILSVFPATSTVSSTGPDVVFIRAPNVPPTLTVPPAGATEMVPETKPAIPSFVRTKAPWPF